MIAWISAAVFYAATVLVMRHAVRRARAWAWAQIPACDRCEDLAESLKEAADVLADTRGELAERTVELKEARAAIRDLDAALTEARDGLAVLPASPSERADDLLARIGQLEVENAKLRTGGTVDQLLRERETSARLAAEVDRLTQASVDRDGGA